MTKRRISKASKRRLSFFGTLSVIAILYCGFSLIYNAYTIYKLSAEKSKLETKYAELQDKAEELKTDIEKFNDPEYLANYARETYLYSKPGEYIIQLDETSNDTNEEMDSITQLLNKVTNKLNTEYIIFVLGGAILIIFIYIFVKGKKRKK